jgi:hypothetical protein
LNILFGDNMKKKWQLVHHVGVFWKGPDNVIGTFRWRWRAILAAHLYVAGHGFAEVSVVPLS